MLYENVMSNCSVKRSPHGGIHDEQEGSAPGGPGARRPRRPDHQPAGRHGLAPVGSTIPPPQEALRPRRAAGLAASQPRAAVPAPPRRGPAAADHRPHHHRVPRPLGAIDDATSGPPRISTATPSSSTRSSGSMAASRGLRQPPRNDDHWSLEKSMAPSTPPTPGAPCRSSTSAWSARQFVGRIGA